MEGPSANSATPLLCTRLPSHQHQEVTAEEAEEMTEEEAEVEVVTTTNSQQEVVGEEEQEEEEVGEEAKARELLTCKTTPQVRKHQKCLPKQIQE